MQEEVENRTVNLAISTTKLTFRTIVNGYNAWKRHHQAKVAQKTAQLPVGKQSIKELIGQNQGVSSIPIEKTDLKGFEQVARKYGCLLYTSDRSAGSRASGYSQGTPSIFVYYARFVFRSASGRNSCTAMGLCISGRGYTLSIGEAGMAYRA